MSSAAVKPELSKILRSVSEVSMLPELLQKIIQVTNDPSTSASDLSEAIEQDPVIATRVLRCANSASHVHRHHIDTLPMAVSYLGFSEVRNLALSASICKIFHQDFSVGGYTRHGLWRHMVSVGLTARLIAQYQGVGREDEIFLAGLLHDLGIILEDQYLHSEFDLCRWWPPLKG